MKQYVMDIAEDKRFELIVRMNEAIEETENDWNGDAELDNEAAEYLDGEISTIRYLYGKAIEKIDDYVAMCECGEISDLEAVARILKL